MHQVSLRDSRSARNDRRWIEGVYRDYLNDLAPHATGIFPALGEVGHREPDLLLRWFGDRTAQVLTILYNDEPVGFAMVHRRSPAPAAAEFSMAEFFIARPWRRRGIGAQAVRLLFDRFDGQWLISEHIRNTVAVNFWRRVVAAYTHGKYQERIVDGEVQQHFASGPQRR
ncbi:MAG TPA: GNAT family N-acetyltransferase [Steroidobacteraceae bacterium]|jgi:predicted acetyltransferase|nr:GNAT family N-acetyltransferase [Steroidobacteraceae bacterium]